MFTLTATPVILALLRRCDPDALLNQLIGLSLDPAFQANQYRLITLIHLALVHARGRSRPSHTHLSTLLNGLLEEDSGRNEYGSEDTFCVSVGFAGHERLIVNGMYVAADEPLQRLLESIFSHDFPTSEDLVAECEGILALSDALARRAGLVAGAMANSTPQQTRWPTFVRALEQQGQAARFSPTDLRQLGISLQSLHPFILQDTSELLEAPFGATALNSRPLLRDGDGLFIPVPSFLSPALRLYLADLIARRVIPRAATSTFHEIQFARWTLLDAPMSGARAVANDELAMPEPSFDTPGDYMHSVLRFDEDKLAHLVVLGCDWRNPPRGDVASSARASAALEAGLAAHLRASFESLRDRFNSEAGLTIVVIDSPGWGLSITLPDDFSPDWFVVGTNAVGLSALFADPAFSLLDYWKLERQAREMRQAGVELVIWPDPVDWWTVWRHQGFSFWPENLDLRAFGRVAHEGVDIGAFRHIGRMLSGRHQALSADGGAETVERWIDRSTPPGEHDKPVFYGTFGAVLGEFRAVAETDRGYWWVAPGRPPFSAEDRTWLKLLWEGSLEWLLRLAQAAPSIVPHSTEALEIRLLPVPDTITDAPENAELRRAGPESRIVNLLLPPDFVDLFVVEDNTGDRALVELLAQSVRMALDLPMDDAALTAWVDEVTSDPDLKMIHATLSGDLTLQLDGRVDRAPFRLVQLCDYREAERDARDHLGARADSGLVEGRSVIADKAASKRALNAWVDELWLRCKARLAALDRPSVIRLTARLIEALHRERVASERGARARQRLYVEYGDWAAETVSSRDSAFRAYRTVIEMAACESPMTGGRIAALSDIDAMAGLVLALFRAADQSDAVNHDLVSPALEFQANGAWAAPDGGSAAYMQDYLRACIADSITEDIENYPDLFKTEDADPPEADHPVLQAYAAEFGLEMAETAAIQFALLDIADELGVDVVDLPEQELEERLQERVEGVRPSAFLEAFALSPRARWDRPPPGFQMDDIYPWIFERRLSLMTRPIVRVGEGDAARVIYGARQLQMGLKYPSHLLETATWAKSKLRSERAQAWIDAEVNRRGLAFEVEIGDAARALGWDARVGLKLTRLGAPAKLGDLDVLAISPDGADWVVIECKWFGGARSPREVSAWLQDYHGHDGDKLDRHLKRAAWIRENAGLVASRLGIAVPRSILGRIVTTSPAPLSYVRALPDDAQVLTRRTLTQFLATLDAP